MNNFAFTASKIQSSLTYSHTEQQPAVLLPDPAVCFGVRGKKRPLLHCTWLQCAASCKRKQSQLASVLRQYFTARAWCRMTLLLPPGFYSQVSHLLLLAGSRKASEASLGSEDACLGDHSSSLTPSSGFSMTVVQTSLVGPSVVTAESETQLPLSVSLGTESW